MSYMLDTNAVIALLTDRPAAVRQRLRQLPETAREVSVSAVVLFELWYAVVRSVHRRENTERLRTFLAGNVAVVPFEDDDAGIAGDLRGELERAGMPIGPYDLLIAAQALRTSATLVTANVAAFRRVPGLVWEDWTIAQ